LLAVELRPDGRWKRFRIQGQLIRNLIRSQEADTVLTEPLRRTRSPSVASSDRH
jgi:hypothetical protein